MNGSPLLASIVKELRLLSRDLHGLALLFVLPLAFILVMSLALQDVFDAHAGVRTRVLLVDHDQSAASAVMVQRLRNNPVFAVELAPAMPAGRMLRAGAYSFAVEINRGYGEVLRRPLAADSSPVLRVVAASDADRRMEMIFVASLKESLGRQRADQLLAEIGVPPEGGAASSGSLDSAIAVTYALGSGAGGKPPTAVQQSVPAWLVFALFFVAIPFSNTFIRERQFGVQRRLSTLNLNRLTQFVSKLVPYFVINQAQVALMLLVGVLVVPLVGGQALQLHGSPLAWVLLSSMLSLAALGLALLIAVVTRTTEQATMLSGLGNIVLAAVGGIMVPRFIMPPVMHRIADWSSAAWDSDGFLELLLVRWRR